MGKIDFSGLTAKELYGEDIICIIMDEPDPLIREQLGFDLIGTTMSGYTPYTKGRKLPDCELIKRYSTELNTPIIAEGGIWSPDDLKNVYAAGAFSAVCGTAITRPRDITKRFVSALEENK